MLDIFPGTVLRRMEGNGKVTGNGADARKYILNRRKQIARTEPRDQGTQRGMKLS